MAELISEAEESTDELAFPATLPVLPLKDTVVFPGFPTPLAIGQERSIKLAQAFVGQTFVPVVLDKATPGGVTDEARKQASGALELAWHVASMLHTVDFRFIYNSPFLWDSGTGRAKASDYLPFWSKVENLTIHERLPRMRSTVTPGFHDPTAPVTEIDLALSEEVVHSLGTALEWPAHFVPSPLVPIRADTFSDS